jgi:2'-5' RNA ligase
VGTSQFVQLHDAVEGPLGELGFRQEHRRFQPHMTLGRVRRSPRGIGQLAEKIAEFSGFEAGTMRVSQIILYNSLLDRQGPTYQVLGRADLQG